MRFRALMHGNLVDVAAQVPPNPVPPIYRPRRSPWPVVFTLTALVLAFACGSFTTYLIGGRDAGNGLAQPPAPTATAAQARPSLSGELVVPELAGKNAAVAVDELKRLGFQRIELGSQDPDVETVDHPANWMVTKQSAVAGTPMPPDALIVLTCTRNTQNR